MEATGRVAWLPRKKGVGVFPLEGEICSLVCCRTFFFSIVNLGNDGLILIKEVHMGPLASSGWVVKSGREIIE